MTFDLWCLVVNAVWGLALVYIEVFGNTKAGGTEWNAGNRETQPKAPAWVGRAGRALANHKENFPLFLTAILVVHIAGKVDRVSVLAAVVYVVVRLLHALVYIAGIQKVRSAMYVLGVIATLTIFSRLLV
jgi:uncharacterized MAPEG superfamily protein